MSDDRKVVGMDAFATLSDDAILAGRADTVPTAVIEALAAQPLDCVETEYPHWQRSIDGPNSVTLPSDRHPVFYGCYDWHSAVHSHWSLVRGLRLAPDLERGEEIRGSIEDRLTDAAVETEVAYFDEHPTFERPYGWSWLLRLAAELHLWDDPQGDVWRERLRPLEDRIVELVETDLLAQPRPFRVGTHGNTAFALTGVLEYARCVGATDLERATEATARRLFEGDTDAPVAYEPLGWDFLSPSLVEADLLARIMEPSAFAAWLEDFLPGPESAASETFLEPIDVDAIEGDGIQLHFVGLHLANAWCLAGIAETLEDAETLEHSESLENAESLEDDEIASVYVRGAVHNSRAGLDRVLTDDYAGSHWLASFALYLLTRNDGTPRPP